MKDLDKLIERAQTLAKPYCASEGKKFQTDPHWRDHVLFYEIASLRSQ